jgi:dTDP-4-amino-4,6-dideoxy-D-galactose acyltransferase
MERQPLYKILPFDSELFEFKVAKILALRLELTLLKTILSELNQYGIKLVYWAADSNDETSHVAAISLGGFLGSKQVTYYTEHSQINFPTVTDGVAIEEFTKKRPTVELKLLAFQAGNYSHFRTDEKFAEELFYKLYTAWITNCVNHSIADKVFVAKYKQEIIGMITAGKKNERGDIGLLAVKEEFRGKKIGEYLVKKAQQYFIDVGLKYSQVVTQEANVAACKLYANCGYQIEKVENFYHFWL